MLCLQKLKRKLIDAKVRIVLMILFIFCELLNEGMPLVDDFEGDNIREDPSKGVRV